MSSRSTTNHTDLPRLVKLRSVRSAVAATCWGESVPVLGVDRWEGTFPSEEAAQAWAAIDALGRATRLH